MPEAGIEPFIYVFVSTLLMVTGQTLWKLGLVHVGGMQFSPASMLKTFTDARVLAGMVSYACATLLWMRALSALPLSIAYPLGSLAYVLGSFVAVYLFGERYSWTMALGMALILAGIVLISQGPGRAGSAS